MINEVVKWRWKALLTPERHQIIMELLTKKKVVKIQELVDATLSSESTIRRDLSQLEDEKKLKRVHGGASLVKQKKDELTIIEKSTQNFAEKDMIAKYAASLVQNGDCIYLDAGTTIYQMIQYITAKDITVVTNGLTHIDVLLEKQISTYLVGGYIKKTTSALIGRGAIESLENYSFDKCFLGVNGIHSEYGYTTPDPEEAMLKSRALALSQETFVLADNTKLNETTFSKIAELQEAVIITNENDMELLEDIKKQTTIKVVTA